MVNYRPNLLVHLILPGSAYSFYYGIDGSQEEITFLAMKSNGKLDQ
jgi:hypothetical protein